MPPRQRAATTADDLEQQQIDEWNRYRARVPIDYYGTRAYNVGDRVPASAVGDDESAGQWVPVDYVDEVGDATAVPEGSPTVVDPAPPTIDPTAVAAPPAATPTPEG